MEFFEPRAKQWEKDLAELKGRLLGALAFILLVTLAGIVGFSVIDPDAGLIRAFFMTAITLTTVGYGEEIAVDTDGARIFTAVLILVGMGATLYFVSTVTAFLLEGQLGHVFRRRKMKRDLATIEGHMIVCGSGATAHYTAAELAAVQRPVVLVVHSPGDGEVAAAELPDIPIVVGDPTDDDILVAAGVARAGGIVPCSESDNENVVITLTARQLNPGIRIVARIEDVEQESKIRKVGADAVVSPQHIGGLRLASELIRPTVVDFLDTMLRDRDRNLRIGELFVPEGSTSAGRPIRDIGLDAFPGILILAVRGEDGGWVYNPPRSSRIDAGMSLVFLGSPEESESLRLHMGADLVAPASAEPPV